MNIEKMIRHLQDAGYKVRKRSEVAGRPAVPTKCRKCGMWCSGAREAQKHCAKKRTGAKP
jgi:hypothetical protein